MEERARDGLTSPVEEAPHAGPSPSTDGAITTATTNVSTNLKTASPASRVAEGAAATTKAVSAIAAAEGAAGDQALSEKQLQQLQLIQLCFYEHEFGVPLEEDEEDDGDGHTAESPMSSADGVGAELAVFDPVTFVQGKVRYGVSLDDLCKDLAFYMDHVKGRITHHVNSDMHTAFIEISGRLSGMESELQYLERPLAASIKKVSTACEEVAGVAEAVDAMVRHAGDVEEERQFDVGFLSGLLLYESVAATIEEDLAPQVHAGLANPATAEVSASPPASNDIVSAAGRSTSTAGAAPVALSSAAGSTASSAPALVNTTVLEGLEAVGLSAYRLRTHAAALPALPQRTDERAELTSLAAEATAAVLQLLRRVFVHTCDIFFDHPNAAGVIRSLKEVTLVYAQTHAREEFCTMFRESVLGPFLERILPWKAATQARQSTDETLRLLDGLERELRYSIATLCPLFRSCFAGEPLNPASSILWPVLCEVLVKKLVTLYEVGIPDAFHRKYGAAYRLLALAESCCATPEELATLRQSPDVTMWNHKWNTEAYAAMRLAELTRALEPALLAYCGGGGEEATVERRAAAAAVATGQDGSRSDTTESPVRMQLEVFQQLHEQLLRLFSPDVFLFVCLPKFLRQVPTSAQQVCRATLGYTARTLKATAAKSGTGGGGTAAEYQRLLPHLSLLLTDVDALSRSVRAGGALYQRITQAAVGSNGGASTSSYSVSSRVHAAIEGVLAVVSDDVCSGTIAAAKRLMTSSLEEECLAALQNLKSVRSAYAHTKKPFPTAPSWYVASVTEPLARFATVASSSGVDRASVGAMVAVVVDAVAEQFTMLARETLLTARKTEESWERLRRKKEGTGNGPTGGADGGVGATAPGTRPTAETATDRDKMMLQLYMDATALEDNTRGAMAADTACSRSPAMQALFALLQRAEWILGAEIPEPPEIEES